MSDSKNQYNPVPGDYDIEKLTDIHSSEFKPSPYARNIQNTSSVPRTKNSYNSSDSSIEKEKISDSTKRIPTLNKYTDMNSDSRNFDYKGNI